MKIAVEDRCPGAGTGRQTYLENRTRRELARLGDRVSEVRVRLGFDDDHAGHYRVGITAHTPRGEVLDVSAHRRLLPDALADAFDALLTRLVLNGIRLRDDEGERAFVPSSPDAMARRPSAF